MKSPKTLIVAAGLLLLGTCVPALLPAVASAATTPIMYDGSNGWHNAAVRPGWITVGQGGAPGAHTWHWNTWNSEDAKSTGTLWVNSCVPDCARGRESYHHLFVTLKDVKDHNGAAYYSVMTWYTPGYRLPGYKTSTATLHFTTEGGTIPVWH
jgi:hypothetical protein